MAEILRTCPAHVSAVLHAVVFNDLVAANGRCSGGLCHQRGGGGDTDTAITWWSTQAVVARAGSYRAESAVSVRGPVCAACG